MAPKSTRKYGFANPLVCGFCIFFVISASSAMAAAEPVFLPALTYASGGDLPYSVAVADLNGDGKPDLLVANVTDSGNGAVGVLLGNGDGTFQAPVVYSSGGIESFSLAVADLNGDEKLDVVVTNVCADATCDRGSIGVLLGNGDGTFQPATTYDAGGREAVSVAVSDVNGDGNPDLIVARCGTSSCSDSGSRNGKVGVLLGNGDGSFRAAVSYDSGGTIAVSVAIADLNGDGKPDIVAANCAPLGADACNGDRGVVGVLLGKGDGTFAQVVSYDSGGYGATSVAISDMNGDGKQDVVVANCGMLEPCGDIGGIGVLLGLGDGTFETPVSYRSGGNDPISVTVADVNRDGKPDVLVANFTVNGSQDAAAMGVLLGTGDGTFQPAVTYNPGGQDARAIAAADVNGDGSPDVLVGQVSGYLTGSVGVLMNNARFCTTPPAVTVSATPSFLWPPNGKMVPVTLSGRITDTTGCTVKSAAYTVADEYGEVQPSGVVTLGPGGAYSFTILLQASRLGADLDGRLYTVTVSASNKAGKTGSQVGTIMVPHDQGH